MAYLLPKARPCLNSKQKTFLIMYAYELLINFNISAKVDEKEEENSFTESDDDNCSDAVYFD